MKVNLVLKPCPFCGGEARTRKFKTYDPDAHCRIFKYYVECADCHVYTYWRESVKEAEELWNRRAGERA